MPETQQKQTRRKQKMKNMFKTMAVLALASSVSFAGDDAKASKDLEKKIADQGIYVETAKPGVTLSGYVDAGYSLNTEGPTTTTADRVRFGDDSVARGGFNLNAFKLALEKPLGDKNDFAAGFRADLMYGQDANILANAGAGTNVNNGIGNTQTSGVTSATDTFVEQAFVQFRAPVGNGIDFKVGRFVALAGYEVIERPANLNITYGNLFTNMIPLYHQGVEASYKFNDTVNVSGAVVNGWNNSRPSITGGNGSSTDPDNYGLIGQININAPGGNANITQTGYYGINGDTNVLGNSPSTTNNNPVFQYDVWGNWKPKFANDKLLLGFNADYGSAGYDTGVTTSSTEQWYGAALYSKYQFTKIFSLAGRADWIHNTNGAKWADQAASAFVAGGGAATIPAVGAAGAANFARSNDVYSYTLTSSFDVWENMLLRAEYRADWGNDWGIGGSAAAPTSTWGVSHLFTAEVVYSF